MKKVMANIILGIKRAFSILPGNKERLQVILFWAVYIVLIFSSILLPTVQMWITDGAVSLLSASPRYDILIRGFALLLMSNLFRFYAENKIFLSSGITRRIISDCVYGEIIKKSARIKFKSFDNSEVCNKLSQTSGNAPGKIAQLISWQIVPPLVSGFACLVFIGITLIYVHWSIAVLITFGNILSVFLYYKKLKTFYILNKKQIPQERWSQSYWDMLVSKHCFKETRAFGLIDYLTGKWKKNKKATAQERLNLNTRFALFSLVTDTVAIISKLIALGITVYLIASGKANVGVFMLVYGSIDMFKQYLYTIASAFIIMGESSLHIDDWLEFMSLEEEPQTETALSTATELNIEFDNVRFRYAGAETYALDGISLTIKQGERIAVVGENGSGKSTFVALLNGFYDDYEGTIRVNGIDIRNCAPELRKRIVSAFQDFGQYEFSLRHNIALGDGKAGEKDAAIIEAARQSGAYEFIEPMERGIDTPIGSYEEGGVNLSGGQWQKIAIARTLFKTDAKLIILDEPTAALDPQSESVVYRRFIEKVNNQTAILISHRLGATKFAERILVFDHGKIVEEGPHDNLMARRGTYYTMYTAQAGMYKE